MLNKKLFLNSRKSNCLLDFTINIRAGVIFAEIDDDTYNEYGIKLSSDYLNENICGSIINYTGNITQEQANSLCLLFPSTTVWEDTGRGLNLSTFAFRLKNIKNYSSDETYTIVITDLVDNLPQLKFTNILFIEDYIGLHKTADSLMSGSYTHTDIITWGDQLYEHYYNDVRKDGIRIQLFKGILPGVNTDDPISPSVPLVRPR